MAAGIPGHRVDGNDVIAVRQAVADALAAARRGEGPTLIEAVTYRLSDHTTADDAGRYRSDVEVSRPWPEDPVARLRNYLTQIGAWGREQEEALLHSCSQDVEQAAADYLAEPPQALAALFDRTYASMPADLVAQLKEAAAAGAA